MLARCDGRGKSEAGSTAPCSGATLRARDEGLYVTLTVVKNTIGGAGDPSHALLEVSSRAHGARGLSRCPLRRAISGCRRSRQPSAATTALGEAIAAREADTDDGERLARAKAAPQQARSGLAGSP